MNIQEKHEKMSNKKLWDYMKVRKRVESGDVSEMKRVMTVFDLTLLGIGSMLGMGVYIMSGTLAKSVGPAMLISFILAGITSILSAFCYAEFAGRAPGTGSAYAYSYITVGEFIAFLLGWNLVLEFVIGTACLARGLSGYIDSLIDHKISNELKNLMHIDIPYISSYPDFFSLLIMVVFSGVISFGVRESTIVNNMVVAINMATIISLVIIGIVYANVKNWAISKETAPSSADIGSGGFIPYGISKIFEGTATCFYAYTGFDTVATAGGEAKNPSRTIPLALILSLSTAILVYGSISSTFTLMWPYYDQDNSAPYAYVLKNIGLSKLQWIVTVGAIAAITGSTLASIFGMARIVYSIAADGLLFRFLGTVNKKTKTPLSATLVAGFITGLLAVIFDTEQLVLMTSLGTLMAYSMVATCILLLRYEPAEESKRILSEEDKNYVGHTVSVEKLINTSRSQEVTKNSFEIAKWSILLYLCCTFALNIILAIFLNKLMDLNWAVVAPAIFLTIVILIIYLILERQPKEDTNLALKVKPVPLWPLLTIFVNFHLMLRLPGATWLRFIVWLAIGLIIYFSYGVWHSKERPSMTKRIECIS